MGKVIGYLHPIKKCRIATTGSSAKQLVVTTIEVGEAVTGSCSSGRSSVSACLPLKCKMFSHPYDYVCWHNVINQSCQLLDVVLARFQQRGEQAHACISSSCRKT